MSADELFSKLDGASNCKSLLKKHCTKERFDSVKDKKTKFGGTIADCIKSGCLNPDSDIGIYACDPDAYTVFAPILDEVIKDYHKVDKLDHPEPDFGNIDNLGFSDLDPSGKHIISTRVHVSRSHNSYGFLPVLNNKKFVEMEAHTKAAFDKFSDELAGKYYPLVGMTKEDQKQLKEDHFLFKDDDRFLRDPGGYNNLSPFYEAILALRRRECYNLSLAYDGRSAEIALETGPCGPVSKATFALRPAFLLDAGGYNDWPTGRGIFFNNDKTFLVWVNEEDHLRLISMQKGGDLAAVYKRLYKAIKTMESNGLSFAKRKGLGYLTFCPSNLGTALRASVHMKIPNLAAQPDFKKLCDKLSIHAQGIHGEHADAVDGGYYLTNKRCFGLTEFQDVQEMRKGAEACLNMEKKLAAGKKDSISIGQQTCT